METFIRKELKYLIDDSQKRKLLAALAADLIDDLYPDSSIYSVYLDTPDFDLMRICENKPGYRCKVRLRAYRPVRSLDDPVFFELKKKIEGTSFKRRHAFTVRSLQAFYEQVRKNGSDFPAVGTPDMAVCEIADVLARFDLQPAFSLYAHRICRLWKDDPSLRLTIDDTLVGRLSDHGLRNSPMDYSLLEEGMNILEIKCASALPLRLVRILDELQIYPASFSKAGALYACCMHQKQNSRPLSSAIPTERNSLVCPN